LRCKVTINTCSVVTAALFGVIFLHVILQESTVAAWYEQVKPAIFVFYVANFYIV